MKKRRRFKQTVSFKDRLAAFAEGARDKASKLPAGAERDDLIARARQADVASHIDEWANSSGLQAPK